MDGGGGRGGLLELLKVEIRGLPFRFLLHASNMVVVMAICFVWEGERERLCVVFEENGFWVGSWRRGGFDS